MADEITLDPDIVIESVKRGANPSLVYRRVSTGERWRVNGTCNQCGLCVIGAAVASDYVWDGPVGTPLAVRDLRYGTRLDEPVTPSFFADMQEMARETPTATVSGCSMTLGEG